MHPTLPRSPQFLLLDDAPIASLSHTFPLPGGNSAWVLDFGAKGLVMRRSAMQTLVQSLGHVGDVDVALTGMGFLNLGMGLMNEDSRGWINMLVSLFALTTIENIPSAFGYSWKDPP
jgi:hypothetical protein